MPYTHNQIRCLSSMGIVPWIERTNVLPSELVLGASDEAIEGGGSKVHPDVEVDIHSRVGSDSQAAVSSAIQADTPVTPVTPVTPADMQYSSSEIAAVTALPANLMQIPLVEIPFRGQICSQLGKSSAPLLILVEALSNQQKQYPFEPTDAKLFDDMLRAIAWRRQDVCLAVLPPSQQSDLAPTADLAPTEGGPCVADLCKPHRDAVLLFRHTMPETLNTDELLVPMERAGMMAWQLPHPALLQESPTRKRQAWNVLKAARARLQ